jgi:hypothetical protein
MTEPKPPPARAGETAELRALIARVRTLLDRPEAGAERAQLFARIELLLDTLLGQQRTR